MLHLPTPATQIEVQQLNRLPWCCWPVMLFSRCPCATPALPESIASVLPP